VKLALGTAQFGLDYGIANQGGQVPSAEASAILRHAQSAGMDTLDTAIAYGDSEQRLGEIGIGGWRVVSKLPAIPGVCRDVSRWVESSVRESLERLRVTKLYGLLLHRPGQLLEREGERLYSALQQLKDTGVVEKIGVSIYAPSELDALCGPFRFDLVQAPFNLLDRRLLDTGWLSRLAAQQTEVHVRSVFLQGLLLMPEGRRPPAFDRWAPLWRTLDGWLDQVGMTPLEACLRDALSFPEVGRVVIGVDSLPHLQDILLAAAGPVPRIPDGVRSNDPDLLNPARWTA